MCDGTTPYMGCVVVKLIYFSAINSMLCKFHYTTVFFNLAGQKV